ncbi:sugar kinase [bacterium]|nr:sugar kinase [bacterium]
MTNRRDCLCAGIIVADQVCEPIAKLPASGQLVLTPRLSFTIGGCAANVAVDMARLGLSVGISGCVGDDLFGRALVDMLNARHVMTDGLAVLSDIPTSGTFVINVQGEDRRFIHCLGANAHYDPEQISDDELRQYQVVYVGGYCLLDCMTPARVEQLFKRARNLGVRTVLDVVVGDRQDNWNWVAPVLPMTDVFLPNNDEAAVITGESEPWQQAARLRAAGCGTVVITCGADGAIYDGPAGRLSIGKHNVPVVDPTGTGDAFVAGFVYGWLRGFEAADCLRSGAALGASCVQAIGATTGILTSAELADAMQRDRLDVRQQGD